MLRRIKRLYHLLIAQFWVLWFRIPARHLTVIGVTGTDGKTTTTTLIYEILKASGCRVSMITSVRAVIAGKVYDTGFHVTTPNAFYLQKYLRETADQQNTHLVLEVTSHAIGQHRIIGIPFAVGVLTNITHEHLDWHGTFDSYLKTKLSFLRMAKIAVLNLDDAAIFNKAVGNLKKKQIVTYGMKRRAIVTPITYPFSTTLPGDFNKYNCLAAAAATFALGVKKNIVLKTISKFKGIPGRMEVIAEEPVRVIVDFAHTPNAIYQVLKTLRDNTDKRIIHVFGSAGLRDHTKRPLMGAASSKISDIIILTEEDFRTENVFRIMDEIAKGISSGIELFKYPDRFEALKKSLELARPGDTIVATGKGHEKSLCRGKTEYPWSDQDALREILRSGKNRKN